ncbi:hypothetical protein [Lentzea sp. HUAS12]|uniref:hypothetical protein n=1 Tax=Lentzea sp. HUAS12 TaxID=2951806 RepID=UPI0020A21B22|nr:hypothetical protein [Lentzea sp. HUAS12]USX56346.1 hypothetical protein ND450_20265 [Lentzea sp. HUAS12]
MHFAKISAAALAIGAILLSDGQALASTTAASQASGTLVIAEYKTQRECVNESLYTPKSYCRPSGRGTYYLLVPVIEA